MISTVSFFNTLNIKPIRTYPENSNRETTITSFEKVLASKQYNVSGKSVKKQEKAETSDTGYKDPVTGKIVEYVDVATKNTRSTSIDDTNDAEKTAQKSSQVSSHKSSEESSQVSSNSTVSASSMKKTKYNSYFKAAAQKYNVSESLLKAIAKAESDFNPDCLSSAGAMGVMQLMPETAKELGVDNPYDPEQNIMGGAKCIAQKLEEFNGNVKLSLAAYNAGSGAVRRNGGVPSYCNTYVNRVLSYKEAFETANAVG